MALLALLFDLRTPCPSAPRKSLKGYWIIACLARGQARWHRATNPGCLPGKDQLQLLLQPPQ
ncbi:MAG: hypothetical protein RI842_11160, partial [Schleiferiaceae bacterium]|nr:hypothetical protein [Schleiferiaceae bacterium]